MTYTYGDNWTFVNMRDTLTDWEYPIELIKITQSVVNGFKQETQKKIRLKGVWQPLSMAKLMSKPE
jgi:isopentenyl diphosphate isomerase/L-lactate dehydrogenase-like FMN-dependent dehydrogenase